MNTVILLESATYSTQRSILNNLFGLLSELPKYILNINSLNYGKNLNNSVNDYFLYERDDLLIFFKEKKYIYLKKINILLYYVFNSSMLNLHL